MGILLTPLVYLLSILPFWMLYGFSNFVCFLMYRVFGYRKEIVLTNLRNSFPEKSEAEIQKICKGYFQFMCDLFLESFKTLTISVETMQKRMVLSPQAKEIFDHYNDKGESVMMVLGHYGNWEWGGNCFSLNCKQQLYVIYHPLGNQFFDDLMFKMRSRFGTKLITMKNTFKEMLGGEMGLNVAAFIADQTPSNDNAYWTTFLNQETPIFWGTEILSRKLKRPIVFVNIDRIKRGYYQINAEVLVANPGETKEGEISELHTRRLEQDIIRKPELWLWSHRRWKRKRPAPTPEEVTA